MVPGRLMDEVTLPKLTVMWKNSAYSAMAFEISTEPVVKLKTDPGPRACERCRSKSQLSLSPG
jgi:hypothetical protein